MTEGIYEQLVTKLISQKLEQLDHDKFFVNKSIIDKTEASNILASHLSKTIQTALGFIKGENQIENQINVVNKIILFLKNELIHEDFSGDLISTEGEILNAVFSKIDSHFSDLNLHLKEITPYTRLAHSALFTGGNGGHSLESELKKEIRSSDRIDLLVSFIKFKGIIILEPALKEFTENGGKLRVITTTYMGASDYKAIKLLSKLDNTEVKISYNTGNERLHAKAYLFERNTGFHTGYIGSSNFSRSALTDGLEWNLKITTKEVKHIIEQFQKTFDSYWINDEFELFDDLVHKEKLITSLNKGKDSKMGNINISFFDINPFPFQLEILEKLEVERAIHGRNRNLVVAATGTGKTIISAFDFKRFKNENKNSKFLFLAHRKEILTQSLFAYRGVLKDNNFGDLWVDGIIPDKFDNVFASVQSINNKLNDMNLSKNYFDFIVIDECHHMTAKTYRDIINYFEPKVLLGLTATPERMDGGDIQEDFNNKIAAEIRLPEALNKKLLCPFQYFGVTDSIDLSNVGWQKGSYLKNELSTIYTSNDRRVREIIDALNKYTKDITEVRAIGFCVTMEHARFMSENFAKAGLKANYLTSENSQNRYEIKNSLVNKDINYLFVVDIFNEGIDVPEIDTVLFLRPTQSLTIFLQQLGRGLRLAEDKECLTVLDFVGNSRPEYNFENKFRAIIGKTSTTIIKEIEDDFPHLPLGCSINLEKKAKKIILQNIEAAISLNKNQLIQKIQQFNHQTTKTFNLLNFIEFNNIPLQHIYKRGSWKRLCEKAGKSNSFEDINENQIVRAISKKWLSCSSLSYFRFILNLAKNDFLFSYRKLTESERRMLVMLHYDIWQKEKGFPTIIDSIKEIGKNKTLIDELIEVLEILINQIKHKEIDFNLIDSQPLKIHSRYTREQILAALGFSTFDKKSSNREGVAFSKELNTELLFINLIKSEENFSPTTMYDDYAINESLFHWQSQNSAGPETPKGISYINHEHKNKKILLFVREKATDEYGNTMGYVFIGEGKLKEHYGSKPMNIKWKLNEPLPHYLWNDAAKLRVG